MQPIRSRCVTAATLGALSLMAGVAHADPIVLEVDADAPPARALPYQPRPGAPIVGSNWARDVCKGDTFPTHAKYEWQSVLPGRDPMVGLSGRAMYLPTLVPPPLDPATGEPLPGLSHGDLYMMHPFGLDWEFFVLPDVRFASLLGDSNMAGTDDEYGRVHDAIAVLNRKAGNSYLAGALGVEIDRGLVPPKYRVQDGGRVAVFGTWIADCGHDDFHTEIHPPLLIASASPTTPSQEMTSTRLIGRPFTTLQELGDGAFFEHVVNEIRKLQGQPSACGAMAGFLPGVPCSTQLEVNAKVDRVPFRDARVMSYLVRPPSVRKSAGDKLVAQYHFTARSGVTVLVAHEGDDAVRVTVTMLESQYHPATLPRATHPTISLAQLSSENKDVKWMNAAIQNINVMLSPHAPLVQQLYGRGIKYTLYDPLVAASRYDSAADGALGDGQPQFHVDDSQPFPVYGTLTVRWMRQPSAPAPRTVPAPPPAVRPSPPAPHPSVHPAPSTRPPVRPPPPLPPNTRRPPR